MRKLFGTDGIRGVANEYPITIDVCRQLAGAVVKKFCNSDDKKHVVVIGKDTRISGDIFEHALAASFASLGVDVQLLGVIPTPAVSVLVSKLKADMGIVISASHNPFYDNGIKLFNKFGLKLKDEEEAELEELMTKQSALKTPTHENVGTIRVNENAVDIYIDEIKKSFHFKNTKLKIVVDSSNGALSRIAPKVFEDFGFDVVSLCDTPNGININDNCGVTHPNTLSEAVVKHHANMGIAFDGDGDRVILADETGHIVDGNQILAILSQINGCREIVSTIMANYGLEKYLRARGIKLIKTAVGDRYISEYMQGNSDAFFGGEPSGHIIIKSHSLTGDGLFSGLKIIEMLIQSEKKCSEFCNVFNLCPTVSNNVRVKDKSVITAENVQRVIHECEQELVGIGKLIVRPSGTEPLIRITAEGENEEKSREIVQRITAAINGEQ